MNHRLYKIIIALTILSQGFAEVLVVPKDYATIQGGLDAAQEGDTVIVEPGIYEENIDFYGINVLLASMFLETKDFIMQLFFQVTQYLEMIILFYLHIILNLGKDIKLEKFL